MGEIQLLSEDGQFCGDDFENLLKEKELLARNANFNVISIVGPQSSGKSTVLNELFGTSFRTMNAAEGRYQVTRGIWTSVSGQADKKLIVFDVEGCDSSERGDEGFSLERKLALFTLVLSDVLILNLWSNDVGRRNASNMSLIRSIIQLQVSLFGSDGEFRRKPLQLLFLLRDYDSQTPHEKLEEMLRRQMDEILTELTAEYSDLKDEEGKPLSVAALVHQDYAFLPHRTFCPAEFKTVARSLRSLMMLPDKYCRGISAQDFVPFAGGIWETIKNDEQLDLPSQRDLLALYRCGRTADIIRGNSLERLKDLSVEFTRGQFPGDSVFAAVAGVIEDALIEYNLEVYGYKEDIVEKKADTLLSELLCAGYQTYEAGVVDSKRTHLMTLAGKLNEITERQESWINYAEETRKAKETIEGQFKKTVEVDGSMRYRSWEDVYGAELDRYFDEVDVSLVVAREKVVRATKVHFEEQMVGTVAPPIETLIRASELDLWENVTSICRQQWETLEPQIDAAFAHIDIEEKEREMEQMRDRLRSAVITRIRTMIGSSGIFFHRLATGVRESLPDNWSTNSDYATIVSDARSRAFEKLLLFAVIRVGSLQGGIEPAIEHFTDSEREDLMRDLERLELGLIRSAQSAQYQRNLRITEVVISTATVLGMAVATVALGSSRRT